MGDCRPENCRTLVDGTGRLTSTEAVRAAGWTWSGNAWQSRGSRVHARRANLMYDHFVIRLAHPQAQHQIDIAPGV